MNRRSIQLALAAAAAAAVASAAVAGPVRVEVEAGATWQTRNTFAVPGDTGTKVSLDGSADEPWASFRATVVWDFGQRWSARFLAAPLRADARLVPEEEIRFQDEIFPAGQTLDAKYRFDSYRVSFFYRFRESGSWRFRLGGTLKVRDAEIALEGSGLASSKTNTGLVPLLYGGARFEPTGAVAVDLELDGLAASQGRAIDFSARIEFRATDHVRPYLAYRVLDGGADNEEVYSFATLHYALVGVRFDIGGG